MRPCFVTPKPGRKKAALVCIRFVCMTEGAFVCVACIFLLGLWVGKCPPSLPPSLHPSHLFRQAHKHAHTSTDYHPNHHHTTTTQTKPTSHAGKGAGCSALALTESERAPHCRTECSDVQRSGGLGGALRQGALEPSRSFPDPPPVPASFRSPPDHGHVAAAVTPAAAAAPPSLSCPRCRLQNSATPTRRPAGTKWVYL